MIDPTAHARLERWKLSLLDLSEANPLLDVRDGPTTIPVPEVELLRLATALGEGVAFTLESGPAIAMDTIDTAVPGGATGRLRSPLARPELAQRLVAIRRAARAQLEGGGVHVLWLGLGMLTWCEAAPAKPAVRMPDATGDAPPETTTDVTTDATQEAEAGAAAGAARDAMADAARAATDAATDGPARVRHTAPIGMWPVELRRVAAGGLRLASAPGLEPRRNPALAEVLRREGVVLAANGDELELGPLLEAAEEACANRPGWRVDRSAQLGIFGFADLALWTDLEGRAGALLDSPLVAQLARGASPAVARRSPPPTHDVIAPLDADASQLAAIAAAGAGTSFVLQGPPGTGKSQTIANLIVHCVAHGKTVLFVSAKIAALEAVQHRLATVGLGEVCLELYGHKAARADALAQLGRVIERAFRPVTGPRVAEARLGDLTRALDGHVGALHRVGPFGRSLHDVIGRLVELRSTARAELAEGDATGLDRQTFDRRTHAVEQLAAAASAVEPVASHPWRASTMERWPLDGRERARSALDEAAAAAAELALAVQGVATLVPGLVARTRGQLQALAILAALAARSPRPGAELLTPWQLRPARGEDVVERIALIRARGTGAIETPRDPGTFLVLASRHRALATEVNDRFTDSVAELDVHALWTQLRRWAHRLAPLRFMALRQVRAQVGAAAMPGMLETDGAMITALEAVIAERAARKALVAAAEPARRWFGELGGDPLALDLAQIDAAVSWAAELRRAFEAVDVAHGDHGRAAAWRALVAQVAANPPAESPGGGELASFARLAEVAARWQATLAALADATCIDIAALADGDDHLVALDDRVTALRAALDAMHDWVAFHGARRAALAAGVGPAVTAIERGDLGAAELAAAWERATLLAWSDAEITHTPALARFHGATHHADAAAFADLDRATLAAARTHAMVRLAERVPRIVGEPGGEARILLDELKKQHDHRPLRRLLADLPTLLPRLAPCLLMSPVAVAQYLDPSLPRFDIVVFDEAAQLPTAHALGALARGTAAVIVGDSRQLPSPSRLTADPLPGALGDVAGPGHVESAEPPVRAGLGILLDDALAAGLPELQLSSHYRSRHEDLIAFANQRYYGDRLCVFPAAHGTPDLGVSWRRVDGVCDPGGRNRVEAEAIVADIVARLRGRGRVDAAQRTRSMAVVTLSHAQQSLIEDLLDAARSSDPELDSLFDSSHAQGEPVLVAHVDAIQGDERDVVWLSIGHGSGDAGTPATDLGPLSRPGGERRLNVAITRAREQLVVVSSFAPEDLVNTTAPGVQDLAALLAFARAGDGAARPTRPGAAEAVPASPITAAIARALGERGWIVHHQVGCGPYKLDLAIVDPSDPGRYVFAIEHDGAAYASAPAARDRDRLRAQVLGQLGWRVHRIWALDWWADPERELQRAHGAIVMAVAANRQRKTLGATVHPTSQRSAPLDRVARPSGSELGRAPGQHRAPDRAADTTSRRGSALNTRTPGNTRDDSATSEIAPRVASGRSAPTSRNAHDAGGSEGAAPRVASGPNTRTSRNTRDASGPDGAAPGRGSAPNPRSRAPRRARDGDSAGSAPTPSGQPARNPSRAQPAADTPVAAGSGATDAVAALLGDASAPVASGSAPIRIAKNMIAIGPYLAAAIPAGRRAPDDLFAARHAAELSKIIDQVLAAEAPMHVDVLARRVGAYFGIGRLTPRVSDQVRLALAGRGQWGDEDNVVWRLDQDPAGIPAVRVAGQGASARREIDEVPLCEVAAAARIVVERAAGITANDLVRDAARLLGFARVTERVIERVASGVRLAARRELIRIDGGKAMLPD